MPRPRAPYDSDVPLPPMFPDLTALDLFTSVIELGSLSRAADAHHITQPSASSRIRTLESQLGFAVLERSPTGSRPTPEGRRVAALVHEVLRAADAMASGVAALKAQQSGLLRIAASYTVAEYVLPPWLDRFLSERPDNSVTLDVTNSRAVLDRLESGAVDLGFIESPVVPPMMQQRLIGRDEIIAVVASRHPWAATGTVDLASFCATPLVLREAGSGTRDALVRHLADLGHGAPTSALDLGSLSAVRVAVISGSSPTVISRLAVEADLANGTLVEVTVPGLRIERELRAVWPKRTELSALARDFVAYLPTVR
jgi:DNA-binding transcriptional LysR family regulator